MPATTTPGSGPPTAPEEPSLALGPTLLRLAAILCVLAVLSFAAGWLLRERAEAWGTAFVQDYGPFGVAVAFFLPDATTLPLPSDPFMALALMGGMPFLVIVAAGSAGSIAGGCTAFLGARLVARAPWVQRRLDGRASEVRALVHRYGTTALAAGALTPLPYSLMAWTCALLGMPFRTFFFVTLLRIPRVALYLTLISLGWMGSA